MDSSPCMPLHNTIDRKIFPVNKNIGKEGNAVKNIETREKRDEGESDRILEHILERFPTLI